MSHYNNIATSQTLHMANIGCRFCNIFYALSCNNEQDVTILKEFGRSNFVQRSVRNTLVKPYSIGGIDFSITDARDAFGSNIFTLNSRSPEKICSDITQCLVFDTVRAQFSN